mmetsp:Transcript_19382/g.47985  ORF Transcript_19382/g.47985 Transcript_19382/m.47985 type:complete len:89 (-) Transcript_19382:6-272(-)
MRGQGPARGAAGAMGGGGGRDRVSAETTCTRMRPPRPGVAAAAARLDGAGDRGAGGEGGVLHAGWPGGWLDEGRGGGLVCPAALLFDL